MYKKLVDDNFIQTKYFVGYATLFIGL